MWVLILSFVVQKLLNLIWPYSFTCAILLYNLVLFIYFHYSERWVIEYPAVIYVREGFVASPAGVRSQMGQTR